MSSTVTNGDYDASPSLQEDIIAPNNKTKTNGSASSPLPAAAQVLRNTINDTDLALSLALPGNRQTSSSAGPSSNELEEDHNDYGPNEASYYWDASTMAPLNAVSAAAIARLRAYKPPPFPTWDRLPVTRRAAVLILLFADRRGDLRVVITMRAASLRNFSGHAAFPGGKADSLLETPYQIARREAWEEIGLPMDDNKLPYPFRIEPLCNLPCSLAKTDVVARPCVAFLHADRDDRNGNGNGNGRKDITADEAMIPRLDAKEVAAVFTAPLANFLRSTDEEPRPGDPPLPPGHWYDGYWINWESNDRWRVHNFHVPVHNQRVMRPKPNKLGAQKELPVAAMNGERTQEEKRKGVGSNGNGSKEEASEKEEEDEEEPAQQQQPQRLLVWGMTGRILVDTARIAYAAMPAFEHNKQFGDERIIADLEDNGHGRLAKEKARRGDDVVGVDATKEAVKDAKM